MDLRNGLTYLVQRRNVSKRRISDLIYPNVCDTLRPFYNLVINVWEYPIHLSKHMTVVVSAEMLNYVTLKEKIPSDFHQRDEEQEYIKVLQEEKEERADQIQRHSDISKKENIQFAKSQKDKFIIYQKFE